jgi:hypothetical protein
MTLWRINDGMPSVADGLLVAGGMMGGIFLLTAVSDPVLNYFEPRGLLYLGEALLFVVFGALGGLGFLVFWRNQKKLREEIRVPRLVFAFSTPPLFLIFQSLAIAWLTPAIIHGTINFKDAYNAVGLVLIVVFALIYSAVIHAAIWWPTRTTLIALWFNIGMGVLGVTAKFLNLFVHR